MATSSGIDATNADADHGRAGNSHLGRVGRALGAGASADRSPPSRLVGVLCVGVCRSRLGLSRVGAVVVGSGPLALLPRGGSGAPGAPAPFLELLPSRHRLRLAAPAPAVVVDGMGARVVAGCGGNAAADRDGLDALGWSAASTATRMGSSATVAVDGGGGTSATFRCCW